MRRGERYCLLTAHAQANFLLFYKEKVYVYKIERGALQNKMDMMKRNWDLCDCLKQRVRCHKPHLQQRQVP